VRWEGAANIPRVKERDRSRDAAALIAQASPDAPAVDRDLLGAVGPQAANLLSASRFVLAAVWLVAFYSDDRRPEVLGSIALAGAASDLIDGRVARWMRSASGFGRWLDSLADVVFVLTALTCETAVGAIPAYIPALIAVSFAQYAIDSVVISRSSTPVRSRLGHWGGVVNFALVVLLAFAPPPRLPGILPREAAPLIAIYYLAAIFERAIGYRWAISSAS
jgi:phosphatidylglycerophosphate synthase